MSVISIYLETWFKVQSCSYNEAVVTCSPAGVIRPLTFPLALGYIEFLLKSMLCVKFMYMKTYKFQFVAESCCIKKTFSVSDDCFAQDGVKMLYIEDASYMMSL